MNNCQTVGLDPEQCDVGARIAAQDLGLEAAVVLESDHHRVRSGDDMVIGQDEAPLGVDDHSGAGTALPPRRGVARQVEEATEERVPKQRVVALGSHRRDRDVDHRGGHLLE